MSLTLLDTAQYIAYFRAMATKAKFVDFFYYTYDELSSKSGKEKGTKFVLEPYDNTISENQNDNVLADRKGMFVILLPYTSTLGNSLTEAQHAAELLCYKVIGQMKRDSKAYLLRAEISNYTGMEIAPTVPGYAGYGIQFSFSAPVNTLMKYDAEDWEE